MATTVPNQLYVTVQYREDTNNDDGFLGFMSPYTKDAAFQKRKETQDRWAYGSGITVDISDDDLVTATGDNIHNGKKLDAALLLMTNRYPRIIKNEPVEGFQIAKSVRRSGWNGSGNVTWRITDPRGFDLEIRSENFARLVADGTIINGVIQGKCAWGRDGANNVLLTEDSEPYRSAVSITSKLKNKISLKDVQLGDTVDVMIGGKMCTAQYLGKMFLMCVKSIGGFHSAGINFNDTKDAYLFKTADDSYFTVSSSPKIINIEKRIDVPLTKEQVANDANKWLSSGRSIPHEYGAYGVSATKIKSADDITISLVPTNEVKTNFVGYSYNAYIFMDDTTGKFYFNKDRSIHRDKIVCESTVSTSDIQFTHTMVPVVNTWYGVINRNRSAVHYNTIPYTPNLKIFEIHVKFGNNTAIYTG